MDFNNYRTDKLPLEETVTERMRVLSISDEDQKAIWSMLAPLGTKHEAGQFHRDHSMRVGLLASEIAAFYGVTFDAKALLFAGLLHDVGKALVPSCTLCKTTSWTDEDKVSMEQHVMDSFRLLRDRFDFTAHVIVWHHRFQNNAYPSELPVALRPFSEKTMGLVEEYGYLLMIADVFDALHRVNTGTGGKVLSTEAIKEHMLKLKPIRIGYKEFILALYKEGILK